MPAYFDECQKNFVKSCFEGAGMLVLRVVNEPTSAMIAYHLDGCKDGYFAVYDLGGGMFDSSVILSKKGVLKVISTRGDNALGGDDFDNLIIDKIKENSQKCINCKNFRNHKTCKIANDLSFIAREIKHEIGRNAKVVKKIYLNGETSIFSLKKTEFVDIASPLVEKTIQILTDAVHDAALRMTDLQGILLVGGATKMAVVKDAL